MIITTIIILSIIFWTVLSIYGLSALLVANFIDKNNKYKRLLTYFPIVNTIMAIKLLYN